MTKAELVAAVAEKAGLTQKAAAPAVDAIVETISEALGKGESVTLIGFGTFEVRERSARDARNPQDPKKVIKVPAKMVPAFKAGKTLKEKVDH